MAKIFGVHGCLESELQALTGLPGADQDRNKRYSVSANCLLHTATGQPFPARAERCCPGVVATMYLQVFPATFPATFPAVLA